MKRGFNRGFTLLECLAVIVLLMILAAILFPILFRARENRPKSSCMSNLKQLGLAMMQYVQDYDEKFPAAGRVSAAEDSGWARLIQPYFKSSVLLQCPSERTGYGDVKAGSTRATDYYYKTDYYYNMNLGRKTVENIAAVNKTLLLGDGEPASVNYSCSSLQLCVGLNDTGAVGAVPPSAYARHLDGAYYVFTDGHVKWIEPDQVSQRPDNDSSIHFSLQ